MKCVLCDYETSSIDQEEKCLEFDRHMLDFHPGTVVPWELAVTILKFHVERGVPIAELIGKFFDVRDQIAGGYKKADSGYR